MRVLTVRWTTPTPTAIDEELVVEDDGRALLLVASGAEDPGAIGRWVGASDLVIDDGPRTIDVELQRAVDGPDAALLTAARSLVAVLRTTPDAIVRFHAAVAAVDDATTVALAVVGEGQQACEFTLRPAGAKVFFRRGEEVVSWHEAPPPTTGFITPDASGLGGLQRRASVDPGAYGAISLTVPAPPPDADSLMVEVSGMLHTGIPDDPTPRAFRARTGPASLP